MFGICKGDMRTSLKARHSSGPSCVTTVASDHRWAATLSTVCRKLARTFVDALFPGVCFACGKVFPITRSKSVSVELDESGQNRFKTLLGSCLCQGCRSQYTAVASPLCPHCGLPFEASHGPDHTCGDCIKRPPCYSEARAAGIYQGVLRATIHQFKYKGRENLARPLGRLLWLTFCDHWEPDRFDWIIPVPLHPERLRKRGFNQAQALVREWPRLATQYGLPLSAARISPDLLVRHRPTEPQTGLKRDRRIINLRRAFSVTDQQRLRDRSILLVDDVLTTGATADICAKTLLNAGASDVRVLTLARALL